MSIPDLETQINSQPAEWTEEIWKLWYTYVDHADRKMYDRIGVPHQANYFTPRPYVDEYNRGSKTRGFVYTIGREVYQMEIPA